MGAVTAVLGGPFFLYLLPTRTEGGRCPAEAGVSFRGVTAGYGGALVLEDVSWRWRGIDHRPDRAERIGQDHAGSRRIQGAVSPSGRVRISGVDPYAVSPPSGRPSLVAVVPQDVAPAFPFSVLEMVMMGRSPYLSAWGGGTPRTGRRSARAMTAANVQHLADRPSRSLRRRTPARDPGPGAGSGRARPAAGRTNHAPGYPPRRGAPPGDPAPRRRATRSRSSRSCTTSPSRRPCRTVSWRWPAARSSPTASRRRS